jgi:hypothetical protein
MPKGVYKRKEETRIKMSLSRKGIVPWNKGKVGVQKCSKETRIKMSNSRKGNKRKPMSLQGRINIGKSRIGKRATKETKEKMRISHSGEKSHLWKGGKRILSDIIRSSFPYRQWRSDVFTRDNFTCQECGDKKGGNLESHHIKSLSKIIQEYNIKTLEQALSCEELWNINNGQTLCEDCHKKTNNFGRKNI